MLKSRVALLLSGAMLGYLRPKLAADSKLDLSGVLKDVSAKNLDKGKTKLASAVVALASPMLAADEGLEVGDVVEIIEAVQGSNPDADSDDLNDPAPAVDDATTVTCPKCGETFTPGQAADADPDDDPEEKDDKAMDSKTVRTLIANVEKGAVARMEAIRRAEKDVAPFIGEIAVAQDSAEAIYKLALDHMKVDTTDVPTSAYGAMVRMLPKPADVAAAAGAGLAADAATFADFKKRFPTAGQLARS